jgi:hypothetical protein
LSETKRADSDKAASEKLPHINLIPPSQQKQHAYLELQVGLVNGFVEELEVADRRANAVQLNL